MGVEDYCFALQVTLNSLTEDMLGDFMIYC